MKKIIIIEDEPDIAKFVLARLQKAGFNACVCENGGTGLKKIKEDRPDLVILDLGLPDMPGEEVCRILRRDVEFEKLPIVMLTAKAMEVDRIIGKVIGADCYIEKPFDYQRLLDSINNLLGINGNIQI